MNGGREGGREGDRQTDSGNLMGTIFLKFLILQTCHFQESFRRLKVNMLMMVRTKERQNRCVKMFKVKMKLLLVKRTKCVC